MLLRSDPRFWKGKVRVSEITYCGWPRYTAEWCGRVGGERYWRRVVEDDRLAKPVVFMTIEAARQAAITAYDFDMDVAIANEKKVWP